MIEVSKTAADVHSMSNGTILQSFKKKKHQRRYDSKKKIIYIICGEK